MVVKKINGVQTMLVSYWDAGYIKLDVSDPANPKIIGDSDFGTQDPVMKRAGTDEPWSLPEGNAHQAEFSHDNRFVLAADEDFDTASDPRDRRPGRRGPYTFNGVGDAATTTEPHGPADRGPPDGSGTRASSAAAATRRPSRPHGDVKIAVDRASPACDLPGR